VILGGVRTATVLVVGTATLVTPVGGQCLGNYIFAGLESLNYASTVFGCVLAALLAVVLDQLVRLLEVAARTRSRRLALAAGVALGLVLAGGLAGPVARAFGGAGKPAVVSSGPFTEQHILNEVLARELEGAGLRVDRRTGMSEGIQFLALFHGEVDCMVNYTGNVWTLVMKETEVADPETTRRETARYLKERYGVVCLGELGFANNYAFALPRRKADQWGVRSLGDLARYAERRARGGGRPLRIAADTQFFTRPEWRQVKEKYGLKEDHVEAVAMDQTLMYEAVAGERAQVEVIVAYTSDGRVPRKDLVLLEDPERAIPPYDAVLLVSAKAYAEKPELVKALRPLVRAVPLQTMREANYQVDAEGRLARQAAGWLLGRVRGAK
jgi:osmoprotectant transport system permease protein